jgi:hypothetical protein
MRAGRIFGRLAVAATALVGAQAALADGWRIVSPLDIPQSPMYLDIEAGAQWQSLPTWTFGNHFGTAVPYFSDTPTASGPEATLALGYRPAGGFIGFGHNERIEVSGDYFDLNNESHRGLGPVNPFDQWNPVGGGGPLFTGGVFSASTITHQEGGELALRGATDIDLSPGLAITPAVAVFGGFTQRYVDYTDLQQCSFLPTTLCFNDTVNERLETRHIGLAVSAGSRYSLGSGFAFLAGASAAFVASRSSLRAKDCFDENSVAVGCQPFPNTATLADRNRDDVGARVQGQLGIRYVLAGNSTIDLIGGVRLDTAVPSISNPTGASRTVSLGSKSLLAETLMLRVTMPIGQP